MAVTLSTGYTISVARQYTPPTETTSASHGSLVLYGTDEAGARAELLTIDPKSALELAQQLIGMVTMGMTK